MIDPTTRWCKIKQISTKLANTIANSIEQTWLSRYLWPQKVIYDRGTKFMAEKSAMFKNNYGLRQKPITKQNLQANSIVEGYTRQ